MKRWKRGLHAMVVLPPWLSVLIQASSNKLRLPGRISWRTHFYVERGDAEKSSFFSEVSEFLEQFRLPWCICDNFNVYIQVEDKLGGPPNFSSMEVFRDFCQLLKGAKIAIKDWAYNTNNTNPQKVIKDLEAEISMLKLNQVAGCWDSLLTKRIIALRAQVWQELRRRSNSLNCIRYNGVSVFDPIAVRNGVFEFFCKSYNVSSTLEVDKLNLPFNCISASQKSSLEVLNEMNFGDKWCKWIFKCVSTVSISVLVIGSLTERFPITRGLRQGCSLSPLFFNIIGEALHNLILKAVEEELFSGFTIGRGSHRSNISHLQFVDDIMTFCKASLDQVLNVKIVL
ncbi:hypothetical protein V6N12_068373 [Hibiscus sabdariffa]|uniref:Reverse transcriptase domain-containing protein n=1 Tax=Hibiscus sabdariffa TaxID=183260 RepID=A0ABR2FPU0_9ROSI